MDIAKTWMPENGCQTMDAKKWMAANKWMPKNGCQQNGCQQKMPPQKRLRAFAAAFFGIHFLASIF